MRPCTIPKLSGRESFKWRPVYQANQCRNIRALSSFLAGLNVVPEVLVRRVLVLSVYARRSSTSNHGVHLFVLGPAITSTRLELDGLWVCKDLDEARRRGLSNGDLSGIETYGHLKPLKVDLQSILTREHNTQDIWPVKNSLNSILKLANGTSFVSWIVVNWHSLWKWLGWFCFLVKMICGTKCYGREFNLMFVKILLSEVIGLFNEEKRSLSFATEFNNIVNVKWPSSNVPNWENLYFLGCNDYLIECRCKLWLEFQGKLSQNQNKTMCSFNIFFVM